MHGGRTTPPPSVQSANEPSGATPDEGASPSPHGNPNSEEPDVGGDDAPGEERPPRTLADLLNSGESEPNPDAFGGARFGHPQHDDAALAAAGIRKIAGPRLNVYTDLPRGDVDDYPRVFEQALPQWQGYFQLSDEQLAGWRMTVYVIKDRQLFRREGLLPGDLPEFQHGFQRAFEMWVYDQPSDYYRRHLLLHEGTHGVMNTVLGGAGPPWYMEGMAELLATHRWEGEQLTLRYNPRDNDEVPYWGRVKIIRDDFAAGEGMQLARLMQYDNRAHQSVNAYAWCWAACMFLDSHPVSRQAFRNMCEHVRLPASDFNRRLVDQIADHWPPLAYEQWFLYVQSMEYGSDVAASIVHYGEGEPLPPDGMRVTIQADRGWQSSGAAVQAGTPYYLQAAGRYTIAREADGTPWPCEPGGVTLRYHDGRPLGQLLLAVRSGEPEPDTPPPLAAPVSLGLRKRFTPEMTGTLYFKVNDSPAELRDNAGQLQVRVTASK